MTAADVIVAAVLAVILGAAVTYIVRAKKRGVKCIGCPAGGSCHGGGNSCRACACQSQKEEGKTGGGEDGAA